MLTPLDFFIRMGSSVGCVLESHLSHGAGMAVRDGGDDVDSGMTYYNNLLAGVKNGFYKMADVDAAVRNTLTVRFELGLFDPPEKTGELATLGAKDVGTNASAELNLRATAVGLARTHSQPLSLLAAPKVGPRKAGCPLHSNHAVRQTSLEY